jgi:hypothetical protein
MKRPNLTFLIENQNIHSEYLNDLIKIADLESNKSERRKGGLLSTMLDCFNYGLIIGKQLERAKHKK